MYPMPQEPDHGKYTIRPRLEKSQEAAARDGSRAAREAAQDLSVHTVLERPALQPSTAFVRELVLRVLATVCLYDSLRSGG